MKPIFLTVILLWMSIKISPILELDFGNEKVTEKWNVINDGVMGGLSKGYVELTDEGLHFYGSVSLDNDGGFTSYKSPYGKYNFSEVKTIEIRYRSTGQAISLSLENDRRFYLPYAKLHLAETDNEWRQIEFDVSDFVMYRLGDETKNGVKDEFLSSISRIGFMAANKKEGDFSFEIDYLRFK